MVLSRLFFCGALVGVSVSCSPATDPETTMTVTSPAFAEGGIIPYEYTCQGRPFPVALGNPQIDWTSGPEGTQSYAIVVTHRAIAEALPPEDPNYFRGFMWAIWDIPATIKSVPALISTVQRPPEVPGAQQWTSYNQFGWFSPCPNFDLEALAADPASKVTDGYGITVYALDTPTLALPQMPAGVTNFTMTLALHLNQIALAKYQLNAVSDAVPTAGPTPPDMRPALVYPDGIVATPAPE